MDKIKKKERILLSIGNIVLIIYSFVMFLLPMDMYNRIGYDYLYLAQFLEEYPLIEFCFLLIIIVWFLALCSCFEKDFEKQYKISRIAFIFLFLASIVYTVFSFICVRKQEHFITFAPLSIVCSCLYYLLLKLGGE